jgi:hypothetical protein
MPFRWPWESDKAYARRLKAWEVKQGEITERVQARQGGRTDRVEAKSQGGYYSADSVAARQGTVQKGIDAGLTAAEGIAQAFGYDVDLNGSDASPTGTPTVVPATSSSGTFGMDQQTMLILAAVAIGGVLLLSSRK